MSDSDPARSPDPTAQHRQPETDEEQLPAPGRPGSVTEEMGEEPDHGEESYRGSGKLQGKVAVVTGADSGIGRAVALAYAREGADVALSFLPDESDDAEVTAGHVREAGRTAVLVPGDLVAESACDELVATVLERFGRIDILVNNAAYQQAQPEGIAAITSEQLDRVVRTNLYATFWLCQKVLPHLAPGSSIINTTSVQASQPSPPLMDYAMTKAAIVNLTRSLSQAVAADGVRVNAVAPGPVWTPLIPATLPSEMVEGFGETTPLGRVGQPAEVAPPYVWLASGDASYITGEVIAVTGGKPVIA